MIRLGWQAALAFGATLLGGLLLARRISDGSGTIDSPGPGAPPVDPYAPQETNHPGVCDPVAKPGVLAFRRWILGKFGERPGSPQNIVRACSSGQSEHEQGRAWDLMTLDHDHGQEIVDYLLAPDEWTGEPHARARRAGIKYLIWWGQMWRAYPHGGAPSGSWAPYTGGESAHKDHIHFSFSKAGADGQTSLYGMIPPEPAA